MGQLPNSGNHVFDYNEFMEIKEEIEMCEDCGERKVNCKCDEEDEKGEK